MKKNNKLGRAMALPSAQRAPPLTMDLYPDFPKELSLPTYLLPHAVLKEEFHFKVHDISHKRGSHVTLR
jgi:hypothetical protein